MEGFMGRRCFKMVGPEIIYHKLPCEPRGEINSINVVRRSNLRSHLKPNHK